MTTPTIDITYALNSDTIREMIHHTSKHQFTKGFPSKTTKIGALIITLLLVVQAVHMQSTALSFLMCGGLVCVALACLLINKFFDVLNCKIWNRTFLKPGSTTTISFFVEPEGIQYQRQIVRANHGKNEHVVLWMWGQISQFTKYKDGYLFTLHKQNQPQWLSARGFENDAMRQQFEQIVRQHLDEDTIAF